MKFILLFSVISSTAFSAAPTTSKMICRWPGLPAPLIDQVTQQPDGSFPRGLEIKQNINDRFGIWAKYSGGEYPINWLRVIDHATGLAALGHFKRSEPVDIQHIPPMKADATMMLNGENAIDSKLVHVECTIQTGP